MLRCAGPRPLPPHRRKAPTPQPPLGLTPPSGNRFERGVGALVGPRLCRRRYQRLAARLAGLGCAACRALCALPRSLSAPITAPPAVIARKGSRAAAVWAGG